MQNDGDESIFYAQPLLLQLLKLLLQLNCAVSQCFVLVYTFQNRESVQKVQPVHSVALSESRTLQQRMTEFVFLPLILPSSWMTMLRVRFCRPRNSTTAVSSVETEKDTPPGTS